MTTENRLQDLLDEIPNGPFYASDGVILPYRGDDTPTELELITNFPNDSFLLIVNNIQQSIISSDSNGNALFNVILPLGEVILELQRANSLDKLKVYITTRQYAVWLAALAEELESIDDSIDSTLASFYLDRAGPIDIDLAHGVPLQYPNESFASLEAYREMLQLVRQSFRQFAGRVSGKFGVTSAITQINPLIFRRNKLGPRWILGYESLFDNLQNTLKFFDGSLTNINTLGQFVTIDSVDGYANSGTGTLEYYGQFDAFKWEPPFTPLGGTYGLVTNAEKFWVDSPIADGDKQVIVQSGRQRAYINTFRFGNPGLDATGVYDETPGEFDHLFVELDGLGIVDVHFWVPAASALTADIIISSFIRANNPYNSARKVATQPGPLLTNRLEVIKVSDGTPIGLGSIEGLAGTSNIRYTSPGDSQGDITTAPSREITRIYSGNGIDYIDVFRSGRIQVVTATETFLISERYTTPAFLEPSFGNDLITIQSQNYSRVADGKSTVTIHDGPGNLAGFPIGNPIRGIFDTPRLATILTAPVAVNDTSISVPPNAVSRFSISDNVVNTPFDIIVGYGYRTGVLTDYQITPNAGGYTAQIQILSGGNFEPGDTHVNVIQSLALQTSNCGAHKIISIDPLDNTIATIAYRGLSFSQFAGIVTGVSFINASDNHQIGSGRIYSGGGPSLAWEAPGDAQGPFVATPTDGYYRLFSSNGQYIDVLVDVSALPGVVNELINIEKFKAQVGGDSLRIWSSGEKATVISTSGVDNTIWELESPVIGAYSSAPAQGVYLKNDRLPLHKEGVESFGDLTITLDEDFNPTTLGGPVSDPIPIVGSNLPDGWLELNSSIYHIYPIGKYRPASYVFSNNAGDVILEKELELNEDLLGFEFVLRTWVRNLNGTDGTPITFKLGFDFGFGFIESPDIVVTNYNITVRFPELLEFSQIVPPNATKFRIRIRRVITLPLDDFSLERVVVVQNNTHALYMGHNTIPRSNGRSKQGSLFYVWSADELTNEESTLLGIAAPAINGRILDAHNAHEQIDIFDVTDVVAGEVVNVRGAITDLEWYTVSLTNMEVVSRTPRRFSFVQPTLISFQNETLVFPSIGPFIAALSIESDQDLSTSILFEDGIPVPQDQWDYNSSTEIEITSGFNSGAIYRLEYQALIQLETQPIDLLIPDNNGNDTWFADYMAWNRQRSGINSLRGIQSLSFDANLEASLTLASDGDKLSSVLIENTGIVQRIIPQQNWGYIDNSSIRINGAEYNIDSVYTLEYNQQLTDIKRVANIIAEIKSASTIFSLGTATYKVFNTFKDNAIDSSLRYHQIRITISDVITLDDVRIHSAVVKGIRTNTDPIVPGL